MIPPEFSRPVRVDTLGGAPRSLAIEAGEAERAALAERFGLVRIEALQAEAALSRNGDEVVVKGRLDATVTQSCIATGEPVEAVVGEEFTILFRPQPAVAAVDQEIELSDADMDVVFYDGASVDLGEAVAETLSLSLDPFPRAPEADTALRQVGVRSEEQARVEEETMKAARSPFAALRKD